MSDFNTAIIEEFRANEGRVGGGFAGAPMLLLTTTGAKSGQRRTTPLVYQPGGERMYIFGSAAGSTKHPAWYHNLLANPTVTVEVGTETFEARATPLPKEERDRIYAEQVEAMPGFGEYEEKAGDRVIPVIALERV